MTRGGPIGVLVASMLVLLAACGSATEQQAQVNIVTPTALATTAPLALPTPTSVPTPRSAVPLPEVAETPEPTPRPAATVVPTAAPDPTPEPGPSPTAVSAAESPSPEVATAEPTQTPIPTATPEESPTAVAETPTAETPTAETPTAETPTETAPTQTPTTVVASSGEPPLECYDRDVNVYRGFVDGVDALSFENGRVFCSGAGTNAVSAAASYRHSTGLIIQRNGDFIFNDAGTAYIPYSGFVHFCLGAEAVSVPIRADSVPALLVVIDSEAQRQVSLGASRPAGFTSSGAQC